MYCTLVLYGWTVFLYCTLVRMTTGAMEALGNFSFSLHYWNEVFEEKETDLMYEVFQNTYTKMIDTCVPEKEIKIFFDQPIWMSVKLKTELRKRDREFNKNCKSERWRILMKKCCRMIRRSKIDVNDAFTDVMMKNDPRTWMSRMEKKTWNSFPCKRTGLVEL